MATVDDAADVLAIYEPFVRETAVSFELTVPDSAEMGRRIAETTVRYPWLVLSEHSRIVGYAYACPHRSRGAYQWSAEVSVYVTKKMRRKGCARRLYGALFELLRIQAYRNAYAGIALPNEASVALHESLGFSPIGVYRGVGYKRREWHDVGWWALRLQELDADPWAPRVVAEASRDSRWRAVFD